MGLDPELVREAGRAKEQLAVTQHAAYRAKVDYYQAIRRLHTAGGSLREIAEALRMSHQRVHQIIDEAAEPTPDLRRVPGPVSGDPDRDLPQMSRTPVGCRYHPAWQPGRT
jgi:hypothetical protein